jgi:hypothetical protein
LKDSTFYDSIENNLCLQPSKKNITISHADSILDLLVKSRLLDIPDQFKFIDSLKKEKLTIYNRCHNQLVIISLDCDDSFSWIELKIGSNFRSFTISNQAYFYQKYNPQFSIFKNYTEIDRLVKQFFIGFPEY